MVFTTAALIIWLSQIFMLESLKNELNHWTLVILNSHAVKQSSIVRLEQTTSAVKTIYIEKRHPVCFLYCLISLAEWMIVTHLMCYFT